MLCTVVKGYACVPLTYKSVLIYVYHLIHACHAYKLNENHNIAYTNVTLMYLCSL